MSEPAYMVGYARPPRHTRFEKGRSGNPGGRPGPKKLAEQVFARAIGEALNTDTETLCQPTAEKAILAFARRLVVRAVDGQPSAQKLLVSLLGEIPNMGENDGDSGDGADDAHASHGAGDEESRDEDAGETPAGFPDDEYGRQLFGDRYDEFKSRFDAALRAGSVDDLVTLAEDFDCTDKFPQSGNF